MKTTSLIYGAVCSVALSANVALAEDYLIAVPGGVPEAQVSEIRAGIQELAFKVLKTGETLTVVDSRTARTVVEMKVPEGKAFEREIYRQNHFMVPLGKVRKHLQEGPSSGSPISLPEFLESVSGQRDTPLHVLYIGTALNTQGSDELSFQNGQFPSDGHLSADSRLTPLSTKNKAGFLDNVRLHILFTDPPSAWENSAHSDAVERFWSLHASSQGGTLPTFTNDTHRAFQRLADHASRSPHTYELDDTREYLAMLKLNPGNTIPDVVLDLKPDGSIAVADSEEVFALREELVDLKRLIDEIKDVFPNLVGPNGNLREPTEVLKGLKTFNIFEETPHPTIARLMVHTGWSYHRERWPEFDTSWCYFYGKSSSGAIVRVMVGNQAVDKPPIWSMPSDKVLVDVSLTRDDIIAARPSCAFQAEQ